MTRKIAMLAGAALLAAVPVLARSDAPRMHLAALYPGAARGGQQESQDHIRQMRKNLLELASRQEIHRATAGTYASRPAALDFQPTDGVRLTILEAGEAGWAGSATHPALSGKSCVIFFGDAPPPRTAGGQRATRAASVVCDAA